MVVSFVLVAARTAVVLARVYYSFVANFNSEHVDMRRVVQQRTDSIVPRRTQMDLQSHLTKATKLSRN